jgi:phosphohistidine swiveling domain-containing protein
MERTAFDYTMPEFRDPTQDGVWVWDAESHTMVFKPSAGLEQDRGHSTGGDNDLFNQNQIEHSELAGVPELEGHMAHKSEWAPPGQVKCPNCSEITDQPQCPVCAKDLTPEWNSENNNEFFGQGGEHSDASEYYSLPERVPKRNREKTDDSYPSMTLSAVLSCPRCGAPMEQGSVGSRCTVCGLELGRQARVWEATQKLAFKILSQDDWDDMFTGESPMRTEVGKWLIDKQGKFHFAHGMDAFHEHIAERDGLAYPDDVGALGSVYNDGTADTQRVFPGYQFDIAQAQAQIEQAFGPVKLAAPISGTEQPSKGQEFEPFTLTGGQWIIPPSGAHGIEGQSWVKEKPVGEYSSGYILCAEHLQPDDFMLYSKGCRAIITATGGLTSHAAYLASTMGIPTIVGLGEAYSKIESGNSLKIDPVTETITVSPGRAAPPAQEAGPWTQWHQDAKQYWDQHRNSFYFMPEYFSHVLEEENWKLAHPATLDSCPECEAPMVDKDGEAVCHDCGHKQPIIQHQGAFLAPLGLDALGLGAGAAGEAGAGGIASSMGGLMSSALGRGFVRGVGIGTGENAVSGQGAQGGQPGADPTAQSQGVISSAQRAAGVMSLLESFFDILKKTPEAFIDPKNPLSYADDVAGIASGANQIGNEAAQGQGQYTSGIHEGGPKWDNAKDTLQDLGSGLVDAGDMIGESYAAGRDFVRDKTGLWPTCPNCNEAQVKPYRDGSGYEPCQNCGHKVMEIDRGGRDQGYHPYQHQKAEYGPRINETPFSPTTSRVREAANSDMWSFGGTFGEDEVGWANKNNGTNSTEDASESGTAGKKEQGDGPEQLKDVGGGPLNNPGDQAEQKQGDPELQDKAVKAFHMNLPLVIEFANSDEAGADNPILQALDALLEEAFPGYKDGQGQGEDEHPVDEINVEIPSNDGEPKEDKSVDESGEEPDDGDERDKKEKVTASVWDFIEDNTHEAALWGGPSSDPTYDPTQLNPQGAPNNEAIPTCPTCGQSHIPGTPCPTNPSAAPVTAPAVQGAPTTPIQPNKVVTKWQVVAEYQQIADWPQGQPANAPLESPVDDVSPGDVIAAYPDGTVVLDDGITTHNMQKAQAFAQQHGWSKQQEPTGAAIRQGLDEPTQWGGESDPRLQTLGATDPEFAFFMAADEGEPIHEHQVEHHHEVDDSSNVWVDESGEPLHEGGQYELKTGDYAIPDKITVTHLYPEKLVYTNDSGGINYRNEITADDVQTMGYTFGPSDPRGADSSAGFEEREAPVRPGQDAGPQVDDLSTPQTVVSGELHRGAVHREAAIDPEAYVGSFSGDNVDDRSWIMQGSARDEVLVDPALMAKLAGKDYSAREQREFIDESGEARNLDLLDLSGTHYIADDYGDTLW